MERNYKKNPSGILKGIFIDDQMTNKFSIKSHTVKQESRLLRGKVVTLVYG